MRPEDDPIVGEFTRKQGCAAAIVAAVIFSIFEYFGENGTARTALVSTFVVISSLKIFWPLRVYWWFWLIIGIVTVGHIGAIAWLPLTGETFDGRGIVPVALLDFAAVCLVIYLIAKWNNVDGDRTD